MLEEDIFWEIEECDMDEFNTLDSIEIPIAVLRGRWWPKAEKQDGDKNGKKFLCYIWKQGNERPNVGGVAIASWNGAPSRKMDAWPMVK